MSFVVTAEKAVFGGDCITKIDGKNVFIPYTIPGEKIEIEIVSSKKDYDIAKVVKIITPSSHRVIPPCKYYEVCGGCNFMHIDIAFQNELRKSIIKDCFLHYNITLDNINIISGNDKGYRARLLLTDGGLCGKNSNTIIKIDSCCVATKEINDWLSSTSYSDRVQGRVRLFGDKRVLSVGEKDCNLAIAQIESSNRYSNNIQLNKTQKQLRAKKIKAIPAKFSGTITSPNSTVKVKLCDKTLSFDIRGFFQSNLEVLEKTITKITEKLSGKKLLDMYAGCGTFSAFLSEKFEHITLVEHNRDALVFAEENLKGKKHTSFGVSGNIWVKQFSSQQDTFDAVIIDPPRSGIEKGVLDYLCKSRIKTICSVSCDIATFARDAEKLLKAGYKITDFFFLDFYQHTCNIESVCFFELR